MGVLVIVICVWDAGLLQEMLHHVPRTQSAQAVMVLCHLALTQPQLKLLPKSVFKASLLLVASELVSACLQALNSSCYYLLYNCFMLPAHEALLVASQVPYASWCDGSDDDDIVPSNPDLLTQIDEILQPCLSCHPCTMHLLHTDPQPVMHYSAQTLETCLLTCGCCPSDS